jgi:hypothetical protein
MVSLSYVPPLTRTRRLLGFASASALPRRRWFGMPCPRCRPHPADLSLSERRPDPLGQLSAAHAALHCGHSASGTSGASRACSS